MSHPPWLFGPWNQSPPSPPNRSNPATSLNNFSPPLGSWRWSYRKPGRPSANRYLSSETARPTRWLCSQKNRRVLRMLMTTMLATRTQSSPSYCGSKGSPDLEKMTIDIWFPRYPQIWNLDNSRGQDAIEAGAFGIFGTHIATGHEERQAQRQQSHLATPRRLEPVGPGPQKFVATRKKGTQGAKIEIFKIAIPYPSSLVLSKVRVELFRLFSYPQAKMKNSSLQTKASKTLKAVNFKMPSGHTNFS